MGALQVEVVPRPVEVRGEEKDRVQSVLLPIRAGPDEQRLLGDAVRGVRLLGVSVPEVVLPERDGVNFGYAQTVPAMTTLRRLVQARLLEDMGAHHQVRVPVASGVGPVRADTADLGSEVVDELGTHLVKEPRGLCHVGEVVFRAPRYGDAWPSASSRSTRCEPRKPAPPVTRMRMQ